MAISFDGTSNYLSIPISEFYNQITISLYFSTTGVNEVETLLTVSNPTTDHNYIQIVKDNNTMNYYRDDSTSTLYLNSDNISDLQDGNYHSVVITDDGTNATMYVDITDNVYTKESFSFTDSYDYLTFGIAAIASGGQFFGGKICEVGIWNTPLNVPQINSLLSKIRPVNVGLSNLKVYYPFLYGPNDMMGEKTIVETSTYEMDTGHANMMFGNYYRMFYSNMLYWFGSTLSSSFIDEKFFDYIVKNKLNTNGGVAAVGKTYIPNFECDVYNNIANSRRKI